jgi:hypothetical protein
MGNLIPNPTFTANPTCVDGRPERVHITARTRDKPLQVLDLDRKEHGELFSAVLEIVASRGASLVTVPSTLIPDLRRIGFLIDATDLDQLFRRLEYIWDGSLDVLIPARSRRTSLPPSEELIVNPALTVGPDVSALSDSESAWALQCCMAPGDGLVVTREAGTGIATAFPFSKAHAHWIKLLRPECPASSVDIPTEQRLRLLVGGILVSPRSRHEESLKWRAYARRAPAALAERGYFAVRDVCNPYLLAAMRHYYRSEIASGRLEFGDGQSQRWRVHDDPLAQYFHRELTSAINQLTGRRHKPSYVYFGGYREGSELPRHVDRLQSELAVSLLVDFTPEPVGASTWPLRIEPFGSSRSIDIYQRLGDAIVYNGCQVPHSRPPLGRGHTSSSLFLMYVREDFSGELQ